MNGVHDNGRMMEWRAMSPTPGDEKDGRVFHCHLGSRAYGLLAPWRLGLVEHRASRFQRELIAPRNTFG